MSKNAIDWERFVRSSSALTRKHDKKMSSKTRIRLHEFYKWAKNYKLAVLRANRIPEEDYLRAGVNILSRLIKQIDKEKEQFLDDWDKCKSGVKKCSQRELMDISSLLRDYTAYTSVLIGCVKKGNGMILQRMRILPREFRREISDLEDECEIIKLQIQDNYGM